MPLTPLQIRPSRESDAHALAHINIASFQHHNYWKNAFPDIDPASTLPLKYARCLEKLTAADVHIFSALDGDNKVVGYSRWQVPGDDRGGVELSEEAKKTVAAAAAGGALPEGANRRIYEMFFATLKEKRGRWVEEGDFTLDFLATLPECQGKGVGTKLLQWGMNYADERDARVYLEATMDGYPLYLKNGWRAVEELVLDFEPYGGHGTATYVLMIRDRKSQRV